MFPYWEAPLWNFAGLRIYPPVLLIGLAVVLGHFLFVRRATHNGLSASLAAEVSAAVILVGFLSAHVWKYVYLPNGFEILRRHPSLVFQVWTGLASLGGISGGFLAGVAWLRIRGVSWRQSLHYFDSLAFVFPMAWIFGRMHCAWVHDHPGIRTGSWLAVRYPDGARYDLGLLEVLFLFAVITVFLWLDRRPHRAGFWVAAFLIPYGLFRLAIDQLHVDVLRYGGLSPDQWSSMAALAAGCWCIRMQQRRKTLERETLAKNPVD